MIAFLREFPKHKAAPEARFRLGELRQRQEQATPKPRRSTRR